MKFLINIIAEKYCYLINLTVEADNIHSAINKFGKFFNSPDDIIIKMIEESNPNINALIDFFISGENDNNVIVTISPIDTISSID